MFFFKTHILPQMFLFFKVFGICQSPGHWWGSNSQTLGYEAQLYQMYHQMSPPDVTTRGHHQMMINVLAKNIVELLTKRSKT
jgi:hypothetical protein